MKAIVFLVVLVACNQAFEIATTDLAPDAAPPPDRDEDGVPDVEDNCPDVANDQRDADGDALGDVCDNCPLVSNTTQDDVDTDRVGDSCDAHPTETGDCLVVLDRFDDVSMFATRWELLTSPTGMPPTVEVRPHGVTITPHDYAFMTLVARDDNGVRYTGTFDTQVLASVTITMGSLDATSHTSNSSSGYRCGLFWWPVPVPALHAQAESAGTGGYSGGTYARLSAEPIHPRTLLRLTAPSGTDTRVRCRVEHGFAAGTTSTDQSGIPQHIPEAGAPGVSISIDPATIEIVALYRVEAGTCAPTVYR